MILSKATGYGIRAMAYLARRSAQRSESVLCGLDEIAEHEQIPPVYLRKVLGELRRHRLVHSVKGIHGGYELARPAETITLLEVYRVLEPDPYFDTCVLGRGQCNYESSCGLHDDWENLRNALVTMLQTKTISALAHQSTGCQMVLPRE